MLLITDNGIPFLVLKLSRLVCFFQFNKYCSEKSCILRGKINNACVAFFKSVSIHVLRAH